MPRGEVRDAEEGLEVLYGVHPVLEALETRRRSVERVLVSREGHARGLGRLLRLARDAGIPVTHLPREALVRKVGARAVHQGVAALVSAVAYAEPAEVCLRAEADPRGTLLLLDRITDPRNLGAVLRSACAAGVTGVLLGEGSVGLTPAVAKTSAGAVERLAVAREPRLGTRLAELGRRGFRTLALDPQGDIPWDRADLSGRVALAVGGEGPGLRPSLRDRVELRVSIPLQGGVESLNVSVAVAILLFEVVRQRRAGGGARG